MSDILSQDEVNALLQGMQEGAVPAAGEAPGAELAGVRTLDLTSQERSLRGRLAGLELVTDRFARALRNTLGTFFGVIPNVGVGGIELLKFGTFIERLPRPVSLQLFKLTPLRGQGLVVMTPPLVTALLQVFFGGAPGKQTAMPAREFSPIELRVLERLGTKVLADLREAWRPVEPIECSFVCAESNPVFATICSTSDLVLTFEMRIGVEGCEEIPLAVCFPNASLDPIRAALQQLQVSGEEDVAAEAVWVEKLRAALADAEVGVSAELGTATMPMRKVLELAVGDVIPLGTGREGPVLVRVEGFPHWVGAPGIAGGNNAVRVTARL
ncbi:MAG: flagellar motor switch protein FliM [Candidatus Binatia bacterium]